MLSLLARQAIRPVPRRSALLVARRTKITLAEHKYTAHAVAKGQGRNGEVSSDGEGGIALRLAMPKAMGGKGDGQNPEQLFAMGYAACFLGALQAGAAKLGKKELAKNAVVHTHVHIGKPNEMDGFGLAVDIKVEGVEDDEVIKAGNAICPYSRMLEHGAVVRVSKAQ